jgi:hypothetical protein
MSARGYVHVPGPWNAAFDPSSPHPGRFYSALLRQALEYGMPARRFGPLGARAVRRGLPAGAVGALLRRLPRRPRGDLDSLLAELAGAWPELVRHATSLPPAAPPLAALALERSAGTTVFVFGEGERPLLVCKVARRADDDGRLDRELSALAEAEPAGVAPRALGRIGNARVQEALAGTPLRLQAIEPETASALSWSPALAALSSGLERLSAKTAKDDPPGQLDPIASAIERGPLDEHLRRTLASALRDVEKLGVSVLEHGDTSAQNCLFDDGRFLGLVDWERARSRGVPGFDTWNAGLAYLDHGVGLVRWSEERALAAFRAAWSRSPFFQCIRTAAHEAIDAAGVPDRFAASLELAFFARRLGRRLDDPGSYATGPVTAASMLEHVCAP